MLSYHPLIDHAKRPFLSALYSRVRTEAILMIIAFFCHKEKNRAAPQETTALSSFHLNDEIK